MNLFKTALGNIKKSSKDYSVYFFTLIIGVAIFYMFNSVGSQNFMATITTSKNGILRTLVTIIQIISVGVAFVLGLLMLYANNFLIKRRKKEFGVYMMLGMSRRKVAKILSVETLLVGVVSLAAGLCIGIFGSQFFSIIVGKLFEADLTAYRFSVSFQVMGRTCLYFAIQFLVVLLFNAKTLGKYELIDLLQAQRKAEKKWIKHPIVAGVLFVCSVVALIYCYVQLGFHGWELSKWAYLGALAAGFVGNFLFFVSLAGFLPELLKRFKGFYFNRLNAFVSAQFSHNLNSSAISFAVISILLTLAICAFSVGFSMNTYLNNRLKNATPVDISAGYMDGRVSDLMANSNVKADEVLGDYYEMPVYQSKDITLRSTVNAAFEKAQSVFLQADWGSFEYVVRLSDYNHLEALYGREKIVLSDTEYAVVCNFDMKTNIVNEAIQHGNEIPVGNITLTSAYKACVEEFVIMSGVSSVMSVVVVPDAVMDANPDIFWEVGSVLSGHYKVSNGDEIFQKIYAPVAEQRAALYTTKTEVQDQSVGTSVAVVFVVLYIGIIFIITSAAVIALKILSDSMDSVGKYAVLMRIGADRQMRKNALFVQILLNFVLPLIIGLCHSIFALIYAKGILQVVGLSRMFSGTIVAVCVMILVYGGYFLITYEACKRIVIASRD